jgi:hypothetical protein
LRCAHLRDGRRLVLLRKLQITTGSALAPGWAKTIEAAVQDAVSRARPARSLGAEQAVAVWFDSWDDAVAAWLDVTLAWPAQAIRSQAWFLPRIAKMAGLSPAESQLLTKPFNPHRVPADERTSLAIQHAQTMWMRWQAHPGSQRACKNWLAERDVFRGLLAPVSQVSLVTATATTTATTTAIASATALAGLNVKGSRGRAAQSDSPDTLDAQAFERADSRLAWHHVASKEMGEKAPHAVSDNTMALPEAQALSPHRQTKWDDWAKRVIDARLTTALNDVPPFSTRQTTQVMAETPQGVVFAPEPTAHATPHLLGWTRLRHTQLGGLPFTVATLHRMGFADKCDRLSHGFSPLAQCLVASAPWLFVWSHMGTMARQRWVRDPMFQVLPVFDALAHLPAHDWADTCLNLWEEQPASTRLLGRQTWRALQADLQKRGWRSPRVLLQRPAWMQLNGTHLDVIFSFDQADLQVRRHGLDTDLGWVPWLGRIVALHFEPADQLSPWSPQ